VLLWRLTIELRQGAEFPEAVERRASNAAGVLVFALAASGAYGLWAREGQEFSATGLALVVLAMPVMWFLASAKIRLADQIGSQAPRADAIESIACGYLSIVIVLGLLAQLFFGAWWIDSATSLAIVVLLVKEGREASQNE
jgi:divalent metal cation (Fe/Co/Zn/Cd) transporter